MMKSGLILLCAVGAAVSINLQTDTTALLNDPAQERDTLTEITVKDIHDLPVGQGSKGSMMDDSMDKKSLAEGRKEWGNQTEFLFILVGYAIGIGNLWRFPYLCGRYGGGAFLIAYLVGLVFCAGPLFFYELVLGQTFQSGPVQTFEAMSPKWRYLAYIPFMMFLCVVSTYYAVIVAYAVMFFFASMSNPLPWAEDSSAYFFDEVLNLTDTMDSEGSHEIQWKVALALLAVWIGTWASLARGLSGAAHVAYFTVSAPFVLILILLFRTVNLPGAGEGIEFYLTPKFEYLSDLETWSQAFGQILFSLSPATGTSIAMASYNPKEYKGLTRDAITIILANSGFSLLSGFVVFSVIGNIALVDDQPIEEVAAGGASLAFVVFARGLALFSSNGYVTSFFSAIFFAALVMVGFDTLFAATQTILTFVESYLVGRNDGQPITKRASDLALLGICVVIFLIGLIYTMRSGFYFLDVVDHFCPTYCLLVVAFLEYILFGWVFGVDKMIELIRERCPDNKIPGLAVGSQWECLWHYQIKFIGPLFLGFLTINQVVTEFNGTQTAEDPLTGIETYGGYNFWVVLLFGWGGIFFPMATVAYWTFYNDVYNKVMPCFGYEPLAEEGPSEKKQLMQPLV